MSAEQAIGSGTKDDPLQVYQYAWRCHHAELRPKPTKGQHYRVMGFVDLGGRCPACDEAKKRERALGKATVTLPCPERSCKGTLVVRTNSNTGHQFLACDQFPTCRYTRELTEDLKLRQAGQPTLL